MSFCDAARQVHGRHDARRSPTARRPTLDPIARPGARVTRLLLRILGLDAETRLLRDLLRRSRVALSSPSPGDVRADLVDDIDRALGDGADMRGMP